MASPQSSTVPYTAFMKEGALFWVLGVLSFSLLRSNNGAQPNPIWFYIVTSLLAGAGVALMIVGTVGYLAGQLKSTGAFASARKAVLAVSLGTILLIASAPYPVIQTFESTSLGFPMPFLSYFYSPGGNVSTSSPIGFGADFDFWVLLSAVGVWGMANSLRKEPGQVRQLDLAGAAALLVYGSFPIWVGSMMFGVFQSAISALGPGSILLFFLILPVAFGVVLAARGRAKAGLMVLLWGVAFDALFLLVVLQAFLQGFLYG